MLFFLQTTTFSDFIPIIIVLSLIVLVSLGFYYLGPLTWVCPKCGVKGDMKRGSKPGKGIPRDSTIRWKHCRNCGYDFDHQEHFEEDISV